MVLSTPAVTHRESDMRNLLVSASVCIAVTHLLDATAFNGHYYGAFFRMISEAQLWMR